MAKMIFQLKVALKDSDPLIWRRTLVPSDLTLEKLHKVLQTAMGWTNSHLHQFIKEDMYYSIRMADDMDWDDAMNVDYRKPQLKVSDLLKEEGDAMVYEYDFGDGWEHDVVLERVLEEQMEKAYPVCVAGRMHCPPEDCGGIGGYAQLLSIIRDPKHPEREDYLEWLGGEFDPESFDRDTVNVRLGKRNYGVY
jgi:hypothetical protein